MKHFTYCAVRWGRSCSCWNTSQRQCRCTRSSLCPDSCLQPHRPVTSQDSHPCPTLQLPHVQQENLYYLPHDGFISAATPRAVSLRDGPSESRLPPEPATPPFRSVVAMPPAWLPCQTPLFHLQKPCIFLHFSFPVRSICGEMLVKLKKDLVCTTGSWAPVSGYSLSGKDKPTYKMAPGSEGESFSKAALGI